MTTEARIKRVALTSSTKSGLEQLANEFQEEHLEGVILRLIDNYVAVSQAVAKTQEIREVAEAIEETEIMAVARAYVETAEKEFEEVCKYNNHICCRRGQLNMMADLIPGIMQGIKWTMEMSGRSDSETEKRTLACAHDRLDEIKKSLFSRILPE